jgi:hypothetical protein
MYLKSFVIGSSWFVFILFFLSVMKIKNKNYSYELYTIIAPFYLGLMNMLSLYLANKYKLSLRQRFLLIGIISPLIVIIFAKLSNSYNYTSKKWYEYYVYIIVKHMLIFNIIIYYLTIMI